MASSPPYGVRQRRIPSAKVPSLRSHISNQGAEQNQVSSVRDRGVIQLAGVKLSSQEADAILQELANHDENSKKTWSRLFVEKYLSKVSNRIRAIRYNISNIESQLSFSILTLH